jgi:hypothetical protein
VTTLQAPRGHADVIERQGASRTRVAPDRRFCADGDRLRADWALRTVLSAALAMSPNPGATRVDIEAWLASHDLFGAELLDALSSSHRCLE